jgi:hypothetical protein
VELTDRGQGAAGVRQEGDAGGGEFDAAGAAFEELGADDRLQAAQALRQGWLGDADDPSGVPEVLLLGQRHENLQMPLGQHGPG